MFGSSTESVWDFPSTIRWICVVIAIQLPFTWSIRLGVLCVTDYSSQECLTRQGETHEAVGGVFFLDALRVAHDGVTVRRGRAREDRCRPLERRYPLYYCQGKGLFRRGRHR